MDSAYFTDKKDEDIKNDVLKKKSVITFATQLVSKILTWFLDDDNGKHHDHGLTFGEALAVGIRRVVRRRQAGPGSPSFRPLLDKALDIDWTHH